MLAHLTINVYTLYTVHIEDYKRKICIDSLKFINFPYILQAYSIYTTLKYPLNVHTIEDKSIESQVAPTAFSIYFMYMILYWFCIFRPTVWGVVGAVPCFINMKHSAPGSNLGQHLFTQLFSHHLFRKFLVFVFYSHYMYGPFSILFCLWYKVHLAMQYEHDYLRFA
jgi:hypothetical protein